MINGGDCVHLVVCTDEEAGVWGFRGPVIMKTECFIVQDGDLKGANEDIGKFIVGVSRCSG